MTAYDDGGWYEYEPSTGGWYVRGIKSMVIEAADNVTFKTGEFVVEADTTRINSEVVVNGGVTQGGGPMSSNGNVVDDLIFDSSLVARSAAETRSRNVAFNFIVSAA